MVLALQDLQSAIQGQINSNTGNTACYTLSKANTDEDLLTAQQVQEIGASGDSVQDNALADVISNRVADVYQEYINCGAAVQPTTSKYF